MKNEFPKKDYNERMKSFFSGDFGYAVSAALIGAVLFFMIYGYATLLPTNVSFLYNSTDADVFSHQLGFDFYRISPWRWPLGLQSYYPYPYDCSVIYTDSIPLLAIIFKLLAPILPEYFQYFGLWIFICFILQGVSASLIFRKLKIDYLRTMLCVPFFIINVPFLFRCFHHSAIAGQWLILFSILMIISEAEMSFKSRLIRWSLLCGGSVLIHGYLFVLVGFLMSFSTFYQFLYYKKRKSSITVFVSCVITTLMVYYLAGGMLKYESVVMRGFPNYVFDPVDLVNPFLYSTFLPRIVYPSSTESAVYFGIAFIVLLVFSIIVLIQKRKTIIVFVKDHRIFVVLVFLASVFLFVLSEGVRPRIAGHVVFDLIGENPDYDVAAFLSSFRATARFILPVWYMIQAGVLYIVCRSIKSRILFPIVMISCVIVQYAELVPKTAKGAADSVVTGYSTEFNDSFDNVFSSEAKHLSLINDDYEAIAPIAVFAAHHGMTLNNSKACRGPKNSIQADVDAWNAGKLANDTIYVIPEDLLVIFEPRVLPETYKIYYCDNTFCIFNCGLMKNEPSEAALEVDHDSFYYLMDYLYDPELMKEPVSTNEEF